jgi:hypothetical protein
MNDCLELRLPKDEVQSWLEGSGLRWGNELSIPERGWSKRTLSITVGSPVRNGKYGQCKTEEVSVRS